VLFTGCRETELLSVTWEMVDLDRGEIRIPQEIRKGTRTRRQVATHVVPLAPEAVTILESIPRVEGNDHVFPGRYGRGRLVNVNKPWGKVRTAAKLPDVTVHDLRRTVASWMKEAGEDTAVIAKVLGHVQPGGVTAIYARVGDRAPREALERHARRLIEVVSEREEKVVPIRRKAASQ
jgi:integrase